MNDFEREAIASKLDLAIRCVQEAIDELVELDRHPGFDSKDYIDRLYTIGGDLELELLEVEGEYDGIDGDTD